VTPLARPMVMPRGDAGEMVATAPGTRAVVSDDGSTIWLPAYTEAGDPVPVALSPVRAVALSPRMTESVPFF
jgi:hypothetical protein